MPAKKKSYERQIEELEALIARLESGEMPLEDAMKAYEKGVGLVRTLESMLGDARRRVEILTKEGLEPFEGGEEL